MSTSGYTVITPNYLAQGLSLRESFLRHNPGCGFYICIAGRREDIPLEDTRGFHFIPDITDERIPPMLGKYKAFEMCCALKPFFAGLLFAVLPGTDHLVYLDGDIFVFGKLQVLSNAAITLSPHRTSHITFLPEADIHSDFSLHRFGVFNAGYFEVKKSAEGIRFLEWWKQTLSDHCYFDPDKHQSCDQLWLNCVPVFFQDVYINRSPGYNMAYWNLIERKVTGQEGQWLVNGEPLVFFHYSHYKVEDPERMSSFDSPFLSFSHFPELRPIYKAYEQSVLRNGYLQYKSIPYSYAVGGDKSKKGFLGKLFGGK